MEDEPKQSILLADGSSANRALLARAFSKLFTVRQSANGMETLDLLRREPDISAVLLDAHLPPLDGCGVLSAMRMDDALRDIPVIVIAASYDIDSQLRSLDYGAADVMTQPINPQLALHRVQNLIMRKEADRQTVRARMLEQLLRQSELDEKTGIYNKHAFCRKVSELLRADPIRAYVVLRWDIDRFRVYNDVFGVSAGDAYLAKIGESYRARRDGVIYGHWEADHFVACMPRDALETRNVMAEINGMISRLHVDFDFVARVGVYPVDDPTLDVSLMCDRALLALRSVKNHYATRVAWYEESMRAAFIEEQEIVGQMNAALEQGQFVVYLQPQCDYARKTLHDAEALVRWIHPEKGLISPGRFIPIFERNGFISRLDEYVWERVCQYQREWLDQGMRIAPISVNVSRHDLYNPRLCENFLALIGRYGLAPSFLRLEITESAYMDDPDQLVRVVAELRAAGFAVEMDDFGSGYSSLNTLKSITVDMLKLDMKFMENSMEDARSGSILTSVIRMAHWIKLPVIAEGVETREQAEYLKSVGCLYIQGYYYARPMPVEQYEAFLRESRLDDGSSTRFSEDLKGAENFLTASTQAALLFNSFVGGAAIVEYDGENVEALCINDQFFDTLGTTREAYEGRQLHLLDRFDAENRALFLSAIRRAVDTRSESGCELRSLPLAEGGEATYTRARMRLLAANGGRYILYLAVENITRQTQLLERNTRLSEQLSTLIDSVPGGILDFELTDHIRVMYANDITASMFGYTHEEYTRLYADNPLSVVHPEDMAAIRERAKELLSGTANDFEAIYRHICPDESWRWVRLTGHVVRREDARVLCSGILMDIDAQVKSEQVARLQAEELNRQRVSLQTLYDTAPCGIMRFVSDTDGRLALHSFNDTAWRLLGYDSRQDYLRSVRGRSSLKDVYPVDLDAVRACIASARETERGAADCDHRIIRADGGIRWLQTFFQREDSGDAEQVIQVLFTDVTERKQESLAHISNALFGLYDEVYEFNLEQDVCYMRYSKRAFTDWTGKAFTMGEYTDALCGRYAHPEDCVKIHAFYAHISSLTERAPATLEYRYLAPDGGFRWISATALRVEGAIYLNCNRDITELRNAQRLARENETLQMLVDARRTEDERSRLFITSADIAVCDYDPARDTMRIQSRSPEGDVAEQTVERYLATLADAPEISVMDRAAVRDAFLDILKAPARRTLEFRGNRFGGFGPCLAQFVSVADGEGKVYRVIGQVSRAPENHSGALAERLRVHTGMRFDGLEYSRPVVDRALRILESASDSRAAVQAELADIGSLYGVSRAYIIEEDGDGAHCSNTFEWCAAGIEPEIDRLQHFDYPEGKRESYIRAFDGSGVLACPDIGALPGWLRDALAPQGIRAILICAIMEGGAFRGYVGFDECGGTRHWTGEQVDTLRVIARLLGVFLSKSRAKSTLELSPEIRSEIDHSPALLYVIDPDNCEVLYCNDAVRRLIGQPMTGQPCYRAFLGEQTMCAICPLREYQRTGVALPVRVHRGSGRYIMQASPFLWEGRKAVLISGSDASGEGLKSNIGQARA